MAWRAVGRGDEETVTRFIQENLPDLTPETMQPVSKMTMIACSVCRHEQRATIDGLLALGVSLRAIAASYGLTRSSVHRHSQHHAPTFSESAAREIVQAETVMPGLLEAFRRLLDIFGSRFDEHTQETLDILLDALTSILTDSPRDQLLLRIARATFRLGVIYGHNWPGSNRDQAKAALEDLESWGRDNYQAETTS